MNAQRIVQFVHDRLDSLTKWEIGRFFNENPYALETADTLIAVTHREPQQVTLALEQLADCGVLLREERPGTVAYRLGTDPHLRALLAEFVSACDDRDFRARLIQDVLRREE